MTQTRPARMIGQYLVKIDEKGRLVLPAQHRDRFTEGAVVALRVDRGSLYGAIYPAAAWDEFLDDFDAQVKAGEIERSIYELVTSFAQEVTPDSAGRVLLPPWLRQRLELGREALITGNMKYLGVRPADYVETIPDEQLDAVAQALNRI